MDVIFDRLLDKHETARLLGVSSGTVANAAWRRRTGLQAIRVGGLLRFQPQDVEALLERGRETFDRAQSRQGMHENADAGVYHAAVSHRPPTRY